MATDKVCALKPSVDGSDTNRCLRIRGVTFVFEWVNTTLASCTELVNAAGHCNVALTLGPTFAASSLAERLSCMHVRLW